MKKTIVLTMLAFVIIIGTSSMSFAAMHQWTPGTTAGSIEGVNIYYGQTKSELSILVKVDDTTLTYSLDNIYAELNVKYYFAVTAYNAEGESELSNFIEFTPGDETPPLPPAGLIAE